MGFAGSPSRFDPGQLVIPGLGKHALVPPVPAGPSGPEDPDRLAWLDWAAAVKRLRRATWALCGERVDGVTGKPLPDAFPVPAADEAANLRALEAKKCAADPLYECAIWRSVLETRPGSGRTIGWQPAIPYPFQALYVRWLEWLLASYVADPDSPADGVVSKPRTMGVTWWTMLFALHRWQHADSFVTKLISKNEAAVDSGSIDAMMPRMTAQFDYLRGASAGNPLMTPRWLWPAGFDPATHKTHLLLRNPANGNEANGEATNAKNVGRSGRATFGPVDEAAVIDNLRQVLTALTATVGVKVVISSESDEGGPAFGDIVDALEDLSDPHLFALDYHMHPLYHEEWRAREEQRYERNGDAHGFEREILRSRGAGIHRWAYPALREKDHPQVRVGDFPHQDGQPVDASIDPGKSDACAIGLFERELGGSRWRVLDGYQGEGMEPEFYASLLAGVPDDAYAYSPEARRFLEVVAALPPLRLLAGDPYGYTSVTKKEDAWYPQMQTYWGKHLARIRQARGARWTPPVVRVKWKDVDRQFQGRRNQLRRLIAVDGIDFNATPQALAIREALAAARHEDNPDRLTDREYLPHDKHSHRRTMVEFFAVNAESLSAPRPRGAYDAETGKPLSEGRWPVTEAAD